MIEDKPTILDSAVQVLSNDPLCGEVELPFLDSWITPTERFYKRNHFSEIPTLDASQERLVIDGSVGRPTTISYEELLAMPSKEVVATLECAGNSRSYVTPPAEGIQFHHGAVGTARWTGVAAEDLLTAAGISDDAKEVVFEGADSGEEEEEGQTLQIGYARSIPLEKAVSPDTIVAYEMNGAPLEPAHGYPFRLIVPGWYGMASVKWLRRIHVQTNRFTGFFQTRRYVYINEGQADSRDWEPLSTLLVKSLVTRPRHGEVRAPGDYTVEGMVWCGEALIETVEISVDGGRNWGTADLVGPSAENAWRRWEYDWHESRPGHYVLKTRATDSNGNTQPMSIDWNFRGYGNNGIHSIAVEIPAGSVGPAAKAT